MTEKKTIKSLIVFHSANKIDNYNTEEKKEKEKFLKKPQNKAEYKKSKYFSWVTAVSVLSIAGGHSPPRPPGVPSNTVLVSGPAVGATQTLIWSYFCVFLPPMYTAIGNSAFSFVGALSVLFYLP